MVERGGCGQQREAGRGGGESAGKGVCAEARGGGFMLVASCGRAVEGASAGDALAVQHTMMGGKHTPTYP